MKVKYVGPHDAVELSIDGQTVTAEHGKFVEVPAPHWQSLVKGDFERAPVKPSKPKAKREPKPEK